MLCRDDLSLNLLLKFITEKLSHQLFDVWQTFYYFDTVYALGYTNSPLSVSLIRNVAEFDGISLAVYMMSNQQKLPSYFEYRSVSQITWYICLISKIHHFEREMWTFLLHNVVLWGMGQDHFGVCEIGLLDLLLKGWHALRNQHVYIYIYPRYRGCFSIC